MCRVVKSVWAVGNKRANDRIRGKRVKIASKLSLYRDPADRRVGEPEQERAVALGQQRVLDMALVHKAGNEVCKARSR